MAFVPIQYLSFKTTSFTSPSATAITANSATTALLLSLLGNAAGNYTSVTVTDGVNNEIMFLTGVTGGAITVDRAQEGTTATTLASGATVRFAWTETSILAIATGVPGAPGSPGSAGATGATGAKGAPGDAVVVTGSGIATETIGGPIDYNINVDAPNFVNGAGINITGTWPNITITCTLTQGGTGTVTSVASGSSGTIAVTSDPTITPTLDLATIGPGAGTYGGITINDYGQIVSFSSTLITSLSTATSGVSLANPSQGVWTVNIANASTSQRGLTAFATATNAASNDVSNQTQAVTPAGVNAVVNALVITPATLTISGTQNALSSGSYTNTISGLPIAVAVASGKFAFVDIYVEVYDSVATTVVQNFGIALFNGGTLLVGVSNLIPSSVRRLQYLVTGPLSATLTVKTTTLTGTQTLGSYSASIVAN